MARIKLTAGRVRDFSCETGKPQSFLWDTDAPGLAIRATANGAKSYVFQGKLNSASIRVTIGDVKSWDIETGDHDRPGAREQASQGRAATAEMIDPDAGVDQHLGGRCHAGSGVPRRRGTSGMSGACPPSAARRRAVCR